MDLDNEPVPIEAQIFAILFQDYEPCDVLDTLKAFADPEDKTKKDPMTDKLTPYGRVCMTRAHMKALCAHRKTLQLESDLTEYQDTVRELVAKQVKLDAERAKLDAERAILDERVVTAKMKVDTAKRHIADISGAAAATSFEAKRAKK
jgi:septal ring factor EnvC (AmiA/AmiB activator)